MHSLTTILWSWQLLETLAASANLIKSPIKFTWEEDLQALEGWEESGFKVSSFSFVKDYQLLKIPNEEKLKVVANNRIKWVGPGKVLFVPCFQNYTLLSYLYPCINLKQFQILKQTFLLVNILLKT